MAVKKGEAPHDRAGLPNYLSGFTAGLAADQVSAGRPAAVGHPDLASAGHLAAADRASLDRPVGRASGLDSDSSFFPLQYWFATSIARFPWQESIRGQSIRSKIHIEAICLELVSACRVPFATRRTDDGTLHASLVAWGANSDSCSDLAFRWPALTSVG